MGDVSDMTGNFQFVGASTFNLSVGSWCPSLPDWREAFSQKEMYVKEMLLTEAISANAFRQSQQHFFGNPIL